MLFLFLYAAGIAYAVPPSTKYNPGETLDPNCAPGDTNCSVSLATIWGNITGTLSDQTDLANALAGKQDSITLGTTAQYLRGDLSLATFPTALSDFTNDENFITDNIYNADGSLTGDRTVDLDGHSLYIHGGSDTSLTLDPENGTSNLVASDSNYLSNGELSGLFLTANTSNGGGSSFALLAQADFGTHAGIGGDAISGILELTGGNGVDQITYLDVENDGVKISNLAGNGSGCVGVDNDGLLSWTDCSGGGVSSNIYTADGSLAGDRTVSLADNVLNFQSNIYDNNNDSGVVFSIDPSDNTYTDLYDFTDDSSGQGPYAGLVLGPDGKYYGTAVSGGANGDGVIYSINPADSYAYADQFDFTLASGYNSSSMLVLGMDDKLYGMTSSGGTHNDGTIFSFDPSSGIYSRLYSFDSPSGYNPYTSVLVPGNDGKFYGTTLNGGANGYGVIFSFDPSDNTYTDLYDLSYSTGASVYGSLILGSDGKFYDTAYYGGAHGNGVIFSFDPSDDTYTDVYDLNYGVTGGYPYAGLVLGNDGKFYGTTYAGGPGSSGVIFSFDPLTTTYTVLHNFESDTGADPYAPLTLGSDGKFYGTTYVGGANSYGAIFSYDPNADTYADIYDFNYDRGANPYTAPLLQGDDGKIYGTTPNGGGVDEGPNNYLSVYPSNDEVSINTSGAGLDVNGPFVSIYSNEGTSFYGDGEVDFNNAGSIVASNGGYVGFGYDTDGFYNALDASNTKVYIQGSNQGGEEIINGDFSSFDDNWDLGYGWEVSGDQAVFTPYDGTIQQDLYEVPNGGQGLGYQVGDTLTVDGGDENAVITVDDVDDNGAITDWEVTTPGTGYELYSTYNLTGGSGDSAELSSGDGGDAYTHLTQSAPDDIENNVKYTVSLDVGGDTGSVEVCLNDGDCDEFDAGQGSVSFDGYWNEDEDTDILAIYPSDDFNGTIDNVSVIRKTQNALTVSGNTVLEDLSGNGSNGCAGVDNNGLLSWSACGIYAANGSLASTRTLSLAGHALNFNNLSIGSGATALNDLYTFDSDHGGYPIGTMILGGDGKFYGVASLGANSDGVIFSYDPDTDTYADLYDFNGFEGSDPESELVRIHNKFYGVARQGGGYNRGVIFSYDPSTDTYMDIYDFRSSGGDAKYPTSLMLAANGTLYGTTDGGGANGDGAIFSYNPTTSDYTKLYDFDSDFGSEPGTTLIQDLDGILYGVANSGGAYGDGVIFSYNPATYTYTDLYDFDGTNGSYADSALVFYDGVLYGSTDGGGDNDYGVIFSYDPDSEIFTKLHDFDGTNGSYPYKNNMLLGSNGLFYGMASGGGANDAGVIYSFDPDSHTYTKLYDFNGTTDSGCPYDGLAEGSDGKFYGTTSADCGDGYGTIFSFDPGLISTNYYAANPDTDTVELNTAANGSLHINSTDVVLNTPNGLNLSSYGQGNFAGTLAYTLGVDSSGNVIETGAAACPEELTNGTFDSNADGWTLAANWSYNPANENITHDTGNADGVYEVYEGSNMIEGNSYTVTLDVGGTAGTVTVELGPASTPHVFDAGSGTVSFTGIWGSAPEVLVSIDASSDFDGTIDNVSVKAQTCGATIYTADRSLTGNRTVDLANYSLGFNNTVADTSAAFTSLYQFDEPTGFFSVDGITLGPDGKFYGTAGMGGANNDGSIYSFDPDSNTYTDIYDFTGDDGGMPFAAPVEYNGKFYGTTFNGGASSYGVIYSYDPDTDTYTDLYDFDGDTGALSYGALVMASDGKFYGTTSNGGDNNQGVIFSFDPSDDTYTDVYDFDGETGGVPNIGLALGTDGKLYGGTSGGGYYNDGVIFSFNPFGHVYTDLYDMDGDHGMSVGSKLTLNANGKFYGLAGDGGANGDGVIFSFDPSNDNYTAIYDFDGDSGSEPFSSALTLASDGKYYGVTSSGGDNDSGVMFSFDPATNVFAKIHDFTGGEDGSCPYASLAGNSDGVLFGVSGGTFCPNESAGAIFSYNLGSAGSSTDYVKANPTDDTLELNTVVHGKVHIGDTGVNVDIASTTTHPNTFTVSNTAPSTSTPGFTTLYEFQPDTGELPYDSTMVPGPDGKLYGTTVGGGTNDDGVIYSYDKSTHTYTDVYDFDGDFGSNPQASLILGSDDKFYGTTNSGGVGGYGVIFSYDPSDGTYTDLYDFDSGSGMNPQGALILGSDGKYYGVTPYGGAHSDGVIYSYDPNTDTYTDLHDLNNSFSSDGANPQSALLLATDGKFYGTASNGGANSLGVIFSYDSNTDTYTDIYDFDGDNGSNPLASLTLGLDGKFYSVTDTGGTNNEGVIYSFNPSTDVYTDLYDFNGADGAFPQVPLVYGDNGKFYGTTQGGGAYNIGVVYSFDPVSNVYTNLHSFKGKGCSLDGLYKDTDGVFYGVTTGGECLSGGDYGTIFSYDPGVTSDTTTNYVEANPTADSVGLNTHGNGSLNINSSGITLATGTTTSGRSLRMTDRALSFTSTSLGGNIYTDLKEFENGSLDGYYTERPLTLGSDGKFYGVMQNGGTDGAGVVFSYDPVNKTYSKLHDFGDGSLGADPSSDPALGPDGIFYGVAALGGANGDGVIYSIDPSGPTYHDVYDFDGDSGSGGWDTTLTLGPDDKFYGVTQDGGANNYGVIFSFDPSTDDYVDLYDLDGISGGYPTGMILGDDHKLYGVADGGDNGDGVIFSFDPATDTYTDLYDLSSETGSHPYGLLVLGSDGKFYGAAATGGANDAGVIFSFDPSSSTYIDLYDFDGLKGTGPNGSLVLKSDGKLYGTTDNGGLNNEGVIFSYDPNSRVYTKLHDFNNTNGDCPYTSLTENSDGVLYGITSGDCSGITTLFSFDPAETTTTSQLTVSDTGNVGVNTSTPNFKLTVNGTSGLSNVVPLTPGAIAENDSTTISTDGIDYDPNDLTYFHQRSIATGNDGYSKVIYFDDDDGFIHYVDCQNSDCSSKSDNAITGTGGSYSMALAIAPDGFGRILYINSDYSEIHYVQCTNEDCTSSSNTTVASGSVGAMHVVTWGSTPAPVTMAIDSDGYAHIAFMENNGSGTDHIMFVECFNDDCSWNSGANELVQGGSGEGDPEFPAISIALDPSTNLPDIAYAKDLQDPSFDSEAHLIQCTTADCTSYTDQYLYTEENSTIHSIDIAFGTDGYPRVVGSAYNGSCLHFIQCLDGNCDKVINTIIDNNHETWNTNLYMGPDGLPRILDNVQVDGGPVQKEYFVQCLNDSCSAVSKFQLASGMEEYPISMTMGADGLPRLLVINADSGSNNLRILSLGSDNGHATGYVLGTSTSPFAYLNVVGANISDLAGNGDGYVAVDDDGNLYWAAGAGGNTIYTADDSLTGNRIVNLAGYTLSFLQGSAGLAIDANGNASVVNNSLSSGSLLSLTTTSTAAASNTQTGLNISLSGANGTSTQTTYGSQISNTHTGTSSTNIGLAVSASGGTNNYPLVLNGTTYIQTDSNYNFTVGVNNSLPGLGHSNFIGDNAGNTASGSHDANFFGSHAGYQALNAPYSNFLGYEAGFFSNNANNSNFLGQSAGSLAVNAYDSNFIGYQAGSSASSAAASNFIGYQAGSNATNAGNSNFIGNGAGLGASNASYSNLFGQHVGWAFTSNNIGSNNIIIGPNISLPDATANAINIGGVLFGSGTYSTTTGNPSITAVSGGKIGIGVVSPGYTLDVQNTGTAGAIFNLTNSAGACTHTPAAGSETVSCSSDERLKTNITDASSALAYFSDFHIRDYTIIATGQDTTGVIAQEIMQTHPELVTMGPNGYYMVSEPNPWKLVKGIQELDLQIEDIENINSTDDTSFWGKVLAWFADASNGIKAFIADTVKARNDICIGETCINEAQLEQLMQNAGMLNQNQNIGSSQAGGNQTTTPPADTSSDTGTGTSTDTGSTDTTPPDNTSDTTPTDTSPDTGSTPPADAGSSDTIPPDSSPTDSGATSSATTTDSNSSTPSDSGSSTDTGSSQTSTPNDGGSTDPGASQ